MSKYILHAVIGRRKIPLTVINEGVTLKISFPYNRDLLDEIKSMERPPNSYDPDTKTWTVLNNSRNLFALDILINGEKIAIYDKDLINYPNAFGLWIHQQQMYNMVKTRHRCILAAEMRTGKTRPALYGAVDIDGPVWWVAPKKSLLSLKAEIKKINYDKKIYLFSYGAFRSTVQKNDYPDGRLPQYVVFDECQKLKTPNSQQTKAALDLSEEMESEYRGNEYIVGLSGTPAPKNPGDWWSVCEVVRPGFIKESNRIMFERRLGVYTQRENNVGGLYWHLEKWKEDEVYKLYKRLSPLVQVHLKKDCLDLPDKIYEIRKLEPSKMLLRVAQTIVDNEVHTLQAINKLRQLSDGFQYEYKYDEYTNAKTRSGMNFVGTPKIAQLEDDLDLHEDVGRLIVYAGFQGSVDIITETCVNKGWTVLRCDGRGWSVFGGTYTVDFCLSQMDRSSDDGTIPKLVFVANPESGGVGLELSSSPSIIYYSNTNKGEARMQSEDRAHSANMDVDRGLGIIDYCLLPTDYTIRDSLMKKKDLQSLSMGVLKEAFHGLF